MTRAPDHVPRFAPGVRLQWDKHRAQWLLQAPEKIVVADATAAEVLRRIDGRRTLEALLADLAAAYDAPRERLRLDVERLLDELAAEGLVR